MPQDCDKDCQVLRTILYFSILYYAKLDTRWWLNCASKNRGLVLCFIFWSNSQKEKCKFPVRSHSDLFHTFFLSYLLLLVLRVINLP